MPKTKNGIGTAFGIMVITVLLLGVLGGGAASARGKISLVNTVPFFLDGLEMESCTYGDAETPPIEAIESEIDHLTNVLPKLGDLGIPVYIVRQRCKCAGLGMLAGCTPSDGSSIYLFSAPRYASSAVRPLREKSRVQQFGDCLAAYAVAHETGHALRCRLVSKQNLLSYVKQRGGKTRGENWAAGPDEIFAEDFRWLFGSDSARQIPYLCNLTPPGEKERAFLLRILNVS